MINTKLQSIIDTKSAIGNAIVNKGGTITSETPFFNYASEIDNISTGPASYSGWVVEDVNGAKYTSITNIIDGTSGGNNTYAFNRWLLNNSAGTPLLTNTIMSSIDGNNQANMPFVNNTVNLGWVFSIAINNGYLYGGSFNNQTVHRFYENNLVFLDNTVSYNRAIETIAINNSHIYVGGGALSGTNRGFAKYHEGNLVRVDNSVNYSSGSIFNIAINNGFVFVGGSSDPTIKKYDESTISFSANSVNYGATIYSLRINNGFIYAGGGGLSGTNRGITKFHESNLALTGANLAASSTANYGGTIESIAINNGFIYAGGVTDQTLKKYYEGNLAFIGNTTSYGGTISMIAISNGFIYIGGNTDIVQKFYESNLALVGSSNNFNSFIVDVKTNNSHIYVSGGGNQGIKKYQEAEIGETTYSIQSLKEE
jgi:hypothetical protein